MGDEEKVEKPVEENSAEKTTTEEEKKEEDFKTAQQKARADFFKDMVPEKDGVEEKDYNTEEVNEEQTVEDKLEEERVSMNVSLIGTPVAEEEEKENEKSEEEETIETPVAMDSKEEESIPEANDSAPEVEP